MKRKLKPGAVASILPGVGQASAGPPMTMRRSAAAVEGTSTKRKAFEKRERIRVSICLVIKLNSILFIAGR